MADAELMCNFKSCQKVLKKTAWVTSCSHIFCDEDGVRGLRGGAECKCPVCGAELSKSADIVKADLSPSESFKSMVLTGLSPEIIIDIVNRAFAFWTYQSNLTRKNQEGAIMNYKERLNMLESAYEALVAKIRQEGALLKKKVEALEKERQVLLARLDDSAKKILEKNRENQKLFNVCNSIRRANLQPYEDASPEREEATYSMAPRTMDDLMPKPLPSPRRQFMTQTPSTRMGPPVAASTARRRPIGETPATSGFSFKPMTPAREFTKAKARPDFCPFMMPKAPRID